MHATDLRARRVALGYSREQLAARLGLSVQTLYRWERVNGSDAIPLWLGLALDALDAEIGQGPIAERFARQQ